MTHPPRATAIGVFVLGAVAIAVTALVFFTDGDLFKSKQAYVMYFDRSIQGLEPGAPLKLRGVKIGEVSRIQSHFVQRDMQVINAVHVEVLRGQTLYDGDIDPDELIETLIRDHGLRAQLRIQSYLTGLLYVEVDFKGKNAPIKFWDLVPGIPELPTARTEIDKLSALANDIDFKQLADHLGTIAANLNRITSDPALQALPGSLNEAVLSVSQLARNADAQWIEPAAAVLSDLRLVSQGLSADYGPLAQSLKDSLAILQRSLTHLEQSTGHADHLLSDNSPLLFEINRTLTELQQAARSVRTLADSLEQRPEALLRGKAER